jgi:DNA-binding CsgD family transcriptional regulator
MRPYLSPTTVARDDLATAPRERLHVALEANDPARLGSLLASLATEGIVAASDAPLRLVDLSPGMPPPVDPSARHVVLTDDHVISRTLTNGGVLPRNAAPEQIAAALFAVNAGLQVRVRSNPVPRDIALTPRELEILAAIGEGLGNKAIARLLGISTHTVKFHLEAVFTKLAVRTRAEAVAKGLRHGLITA